jgi:hypothetical protein
MGQKEDGSFHRIVRGKGREIDKRGKGGEIDKRGKGGEIDKRGKDFGQ